jgi:molecular chaperone GrpE
MLDNLERALEAARAAAGAEAIVAGVEMVARSMLDFLRTHGVAQQSAVGRQFDPALHEAIAQIPTDAHPLNSVVEEFHRGYQIGDRVLRPARVSVAAAPSSGRNKGENASSDVEND